MPDNQSVEVGFIEKNSRARYVISTTEWRNTVYFDIREYYLGNDDEWKPTKKGVRLSSEFLPELFELLKKIDTNPSEKPEE